MKTKEELAKYLVAKKEASLAHGAWEIFRGTSNIKKLKTAKKDPEFQAFCQNFFLNDPDYVFMTSPGFLESPGFLKKYDDYVSRENQKSARAAAKSEWKEWAKSEEAQKAAERALLSAMDDIYTAFRKFLLSKRPDVFFCENDSESFGSFLDGLISDMRSGNTKKYLGKSVSDFAASALLRDVSATPYAERLKKAGLSPKTHALTFSGKFSENANPDLYAERFTKDEILRLLSLNPRCKNAVSEWEIFFEKKARMERAILREIPEDITELFPAARSLKRHFILHVGSTNSGKTHDAFEALAASPSGVYLAPPCGLWPMRLTRRFRKCACLRR